MNLIDIYKTCLSENKELEIIKNYPGLVLIYKIKERC